MAIALMAVAVPAVGAAPVPGAGALHRWGVSGTASFDSGYLYVDAAHWELPGEPAEAWLTLSGGDWDNPWWCYVQGYDDDSVLPEVRFVGRDTVTVVGNFASSVMSCSGAPPDTISFSLEFSAATVYLMDSRVRVTVVKGGSCCAPVDTHELIWQGEEVTITGVFNGESATSTLWGQFVMATIPAG